MCDSYKLDISAIYDKLKKIEDKNTQDQISKKFRDIMINPYSGEKKKHNLKGHYAKKIKGQRYVLLYKIIEEDCLVIFIDFGPHDEIYKKYS